MQCISPPGPRIETDTAGARATAGSVDADRAVRDIVGGSA